MLVTNIQIATKNFTEVLARRFQEYGVNFTVASHVLY
jgi:hypothetical protein